MYGENSKLEWITYALGQLTYIKLALVNWLDQQKWDLDFLFMLFSREI